MEGTRHGDEPAHRSQIWIFYFVVCVLVSGVSIFVFWSWVSADTATAAERTQRALPFVTLTGLALLIPFRRQLRERARVTEALLRANRAMGSIARLTAAGTEPQPTADVLSELLRLGLEAVHAPAGAIYISSGPDSPLRLFVRQGDGFAEEVTMADGAEPSERVSELPDPPGAWRTLPLLHGRESLGVLVVGYGAAGAGDEDDQRIVQVVADRAAAVLRTAAIADAGWRSRMGADHARRQLALLAEGSKALVSGLDDYDAGLRSLASVVVPDFADWCAVDLVESGEIRRVAAMHVDPTVDPYVPDRDGDWRAPCRRVMTSGKSELEWVRWTPERSVAMIAPGITSYLVVPIRLHGLSIGAICCGTIPPRRGYRPSDVAAVEELAARVATALERVSLFRSTEDSAAESAGRAAQLRRLMDAAVAIHAERGALETATTVADHARRVLGAQSAMVFVPGANRDAIRVVLSGDRDPKVLEDVDEEVLYALSKSTAEEGHLGRLVDDSGAITALVARLTDGIGQPLGVLAVADKSGGSFTDDDEPSLVSLAQLASIALDNAHLYDSLRAGENRLRALIDASPVAIVEFDLDTNARLWNHAATNLLGAVTETNDGFRLGFHSDTWKLFRRLVDDVATHGHATPIEDLAWRPDGTEIPLSLVAAPLRSATDAVNGVLVLATDVTDRLQLQDQLNRAQRLEAVGQVAGGVAHDFNNLLTVILGHAELLQAELGETHPSLDDVVALRSAAERAASVTSQLLTISRGDLVAAEVFDPRDRLRAMRETVRSVVPAGTDLVMEIDDGEGFVRMSPAQYEQVVLNLVFNTRDAMPDGGSLTVGLVDHGEQVVLTVSDTGEGMSPEVAERCFEPFFSTKSATRGTGLGLATVYSIVTGAGGTVSVLSSVGLGSAFTTRFPRVVGSPAVEHPQRVPVRRGGGRILLVEDEDGLRQLAAEVLRGAGYVVTAVPDGQAALDLINTDGELPDLLITDVVMPRLNGVELARRMSVDHPQVSVLFVSGYAETATREDLNGADVLIKPFLLRDLTNKVDEVFERAASSRPSAG